MAEGVKIWPLADSWAAATEAVSGAYGVSVNVLRAESRGRGARPPANTWEAKKMAVHLAVILSACSYAELARLVGYNRDTITSHCAAVREACALDEEMQAKSEALHRFAVGRLEAAEQIRAPAFAVEPETTAQAMARMERQLGFLQAQVDRLNGLVGRDRVHPTVPCAHENVIGLPPQSARRRA